jgi:hypothetical protein
VRRRRARRLSATVISVATSTAFTDARIMAMASSGMISSDVSVTVLPFGKEEIKKKKIVQHE